MRERGEEERGKQRWEGEVERGEGERGGREERVWP